MRKKVLFSLLTASFLSVSFFVKAQDTQYQYLSGTDKDHTVNWDFYINTGQKSGKWGKIAVPSNWEQQGYGTYNYYRDIKNPEETGNYKYHFKVPASSASKNVFLVFEAAMTDTRVLINGREAGPVHQGGFYRFKYDITSLLNFNGDNLLEVTVSKRSANESVNLAERKADFWLFGGIYRPVYLETVPKTYIDRIAIDAKANGALSVDVYTGALHTANTITAQVKHLNGRSVTLPFSIKAPSGSQTVRLSQQVKGIIAWNPEMPVLYELFVSINGPNGVIHRVKQRFGFRTAELRTGDGFYVNGKKIAFKGVNRHSEWPESGRALSKEISLLDVTLMKDMNMNAVRMSHYPPDQHFLDVCDSLGLFVLDELTGWQDKYDTEVGKKLVKELVVRDVNHPSIVIWDNGNEGGFNFDLDNEFAKYDPQSRLVIHPWAKFNGTDTKHYPDYNYIVNSVLYGNEVFFPTEFMHGLEDGGHGAGLDDFWDLMRKHPHFAGGFLWSFHDEGVARTDRNGEIDIQGNAAPDGILGPHREKEASFYSIKEIWSPIVVDEANIPDDFDGRLLIENRYIYTDLDKCSFSWKLVKLQLPNGKGQVINASGKAALHLEPGAKAYLNLSIPAGHLHSDVLYLTAYDAFHREVITRSWGLHSPQIQLQPPAEIKENSITESEQAGIVLITANNIGYYFDVASGYLQKVVTSKGEISLSGGPALAGVKDTLKKFNYYTSGDSCLVEALYKGTAPFYVKWTFSPGKKVKLDYEYDQKGVFEFSGITFNYPENLVKGMTWEGRGPYRVWKNRLKGQQFGVWHNDYNNTITGESWKYPEFKGYYSELHWITLDNKQAAFTIYTEQKGIFLQMFKPERPAGATNENTNPPFPAGNIGFLNSIPPIGTKFQAPDKLGPQSQKNVQFNYAPVKGTLWFDFNAG